jgi:6-pyruvoyltetrahydropterin/6-carboxytetrahydropterin synthase
MYTIAKEFHFSASHQLFDLPEGHQCARLHGHNYVLTVVLADDTLNEVGFVRDYGDLKDIKHYVDTVLDHRHLNNVFDFNTTAENMCKEIYDKFKPTYTQLKAIQLSETPKTTAEYKPT